jgi:hypothetical protein
MTPSRPTKDRILSYPSFQFVFDLIGSLILWSFVLLSLFSSDKGGVVAAALLLIFYNGIDGLLTYHMAKKGYMLA